MARLADKRGGVTALSVGEATVIPVPLEAILLPMMLARPTRSFALAAWAVAGCVVGAVMLYALAALAADSVVMPALDAAGLREDFDEMVAALDGAGFFIAVFLIAISPAPMQLAALAAGAGGAPVLVFAGAVVSSRALRYGGLAVAARLVGPRLEALRVPPWAIVAVCVVAALGAGLFL